MASIRRSDIMCKNYQKGRPVKCERERINKRHQACKWKDTKRVYLAGSFDRWRKLKSTLKLKDSSLAWHLMKAHDTKQCHVCRSNNHIDVGSGQQYNSQANCGQSDFLTSLMVTLRQLCLAHFDFHECIDVVGLLCLEFDKLRKETFSINESIKSREGVAQSIPGSALKCSPEESPECESSQSQGLNHGQGGPQAAESSTQNATSPCSSDLSLASGHSLSDHVRQTSSNFETPVLDKNVLESTIGQDKLCANKDSALTGLLNNTFEGNKLRDDNDASMETCTEPTEAEDLHSTMENQHWHKAKEAQVMNSSCHLSDSEPSFDIDIEKMDTSQEGDNICVTFQENHIKSALPDDSSSDKTPPVEESLGSIESAGSDDTKRSTKSAEAAAKQQLMQPSQVAAQESELSRVKDAPLDMSMLKVNVKVERDDSLTPHSGQDCSSEASSPTYRENEDVHLEHSPFASQRKMSDTSNLSSQCSRPSPYWLEGIQTLSGKMRDEIHANIPWQRRDMSRKEEYEYLEMNPFSDLAEFSQHYPNVHQRTYYRWKRRIKEEFMVLEQCPDMSFAEFSSIVVQAKESVFNHWQSLIAQGKGFFAPSDVSKRLDVKTSAKIASNQNSAYSFLQKNLTCTYEQFCQQFPGTSLDVYQVLRRKGMQEFWLLYQNQHMSYTDFSKLITISEDVFNAWRKYAENLNALSSTPETSSRQHVSSEGYQPLKDGSSALKEAKAAAIGNSQMSESMARSLSSSYLASLQNMMFPWHGYYGLTSSLSQQMLPMMLWPGMMGLAGGVSSSPLGFLSGSLPGEGVRNSDVRATSGGLVAMKTEEPQVQSQAGVRSTNKRPRNHESQQLTSSVEETQLKVAFEKEEADCFSPVGRTRKQNKQEYIYYLKNPELGFKELEMLFPSISVRTLYRWRKEMNAAVLLLQENQAITFHQFRMVFPDIPEDIFNLWKEKVYQGWLLTSHKPTQLLQPSEDIELVEQDMLHLDQQCIEESLLEKIDSSNLAMRNSFQDVTNHVDYVNGGSTPGSSKNVKESYTYVQRNPNIDFASFSKFYPNISLRTFYRWKKEIKDAIDSLRGCPDASFQAFSTVNASVTKEVFSVWKSLAASDCNVKEELSDSSTPEASSDGPLSEESSQGLLEDSSFLKYRREYDYLQLNPSIDFSQFTSSFPDVSESTFSMWKREISQIIDYVRSHPTVEYVDVASVLPQISEEAFKTWRHIIASETKAEAGGKNDMSGSEGHTLDRGSSVSEDEVKSKMTSALLHLMRHPTMRYSIFKTCFDYVSATTFKMWLERIRSVVTSIVSNPVLDYQTFSAGTKDIPEDIFDIWRNLTPDQMSSLDTECTEDYDSASLEGTDYDKNYTRKAQPSDYSTEAFDYCQMNPEVTFENFSMAYPTVSEPLFCEWMSRIRREEPSMLENSDVSTDSFPKSDGQAGIDMYNLWKSGGQDQAPSPQKSTPQTFSDKTISAQAVDKDSHLEPVNGRGSFPSPDLRDEYRKDLTTQSYRKETDATELVDRDLTDTVAKINHESVITVDPKTYLPGKCSAVVTQLLQDSTTAIKFEPSLPSEIEDGGLSVPHVTGSTHYTHGFSQMNPHSEARHSSSVQPPSLPSSSLSALIAMSRPENIQNDRGMTISPPQESSSQQSHPSYYAGSANWQQVSQGPGNFNYLGSMKQEEDEAFSSQRQKKMSRAEYLFVKDNPDVDSQEFSRIFPGVSARTFYRWKKEIKAQHH